MGASVTSSNQARAPSYPARGNGRPEISADLSARTAQPVTDESFSPLRAAYRQAFPGFWAAIVKSTAFCASSLKRLDPVSPYASESARAATEWLYRYFGAARPPTQPSASWFRIIHWSPRRTTSPNWMPS